VTHLRSAKLDRAEITIGDAIGNAIGEVTATS
jgi:hypothetical protein